MIFQGELIKNHTTIKIGGYVKYFSQPKTLDELIYIVKLARDKDLKIIPISNGSDIIFADYDLDIVVIKLDKLKGIEVYDDLVEIMVGEGLPRVAIYLEDLGLSGFEYLYGIPGKIGGAISKNAGAYGMEIKDLLLKAYIVSWDGELIELGKDKLNLRYRDSDVLKYGVLYKALFKLRKDSPESIKLRRESLSERRKLTQPYGVFTAGCMFKNPNGYSAGRLIESVGLKGYKIGDVVISNKHANFFINLGDGKFDDVMKLMDMAKERVYENYGILLEEEVVIVR
ncbi:MAG: UDP-N-acetylmuramate dehydrogenase [candidate division WOR-3 bacterium]|nr:UDP-N-acetylmuramate dehydrogenase [candidate division WOR-3 bacterium]MDW8151016.1 UDP-N-acetylmuramate dehydrogenase [candidate division WOR-3 bacterium]